MNFFKRLRQRVRNFFSEYLVVPPEQIREISENYLSQGVLQFFQPIYQTNGVDLYLKDLEGLKRYKLMQTRDNKPLNKIKERYISSSLKNIQSRVGGFVSGIERGLDWILDNTNPFQDFESLEFCYSPKYNSFETKMIRGGYQFRYG